MHRSDGIIRLNQKARWDIWSYADFADIAFAYIVLCGFCGYWLLPSLHLMLAPHDLMHDGRERRERALSQ
jgi:hypothetical protein